MKLNTPSAHYKRKDAETASQPALILMTYDAALRFVKEAQQFMKNGKIPEKGQAIDSAFSCVAELRRALDMERGGDIANSLFSMYNYMTDQITRANFANDPAQLEPVKESLATLRKGWQEVIDKLQEEGQLAQYETPQSPGLLVR
ncbi:flagellar export chaperone FliS [bacterium]|nr:flagellar export chaperone FliS [bacterium]MBU1936682.1 flagellar export chaperone FliS [bacterium]